MLGQYAGADKSPFVQDFLTCNFFTHMIRKHREDCQVGNLKKLKEKKSLCRNFSFDGSLHRNPDYIRYRAENAEMSNKVGKRIKGLRRLKGFTQQELAEKIDISVTMLSHIERGLRKPEPRILELIVAVLEVPSEELFFLPDGETK